MTALARCFVLVALSLGTAASSARAQTPPGPALEPATPLAEATELAPEAAVQPPGPEGYPSRGRLGIEVAPMTEELREFFRGPVDRGVLIVRLEAGRPARLAGLQVGDVLLAASGEPLERPHELVAVVARAPAGEKITLELVRAGSVERVELVPDGEPIAAAELDRWHAFGPPGMHRPGPPPGMRSEILRRLDAIEQRLEGIEKRGLAE